MNLTCRNGVYSDMRAIALALGSTVGALLMTLGQVKDTVRTGPGDMQLLPGYLHEHRQGIDSCPGRIRKSGGDVEIRYDIGFLSGDYARHQANEPGVAWTRTARTAGNSVVMVTMTRQRYLVVTVDGRANFFVQNVTDEVLADVLLMVMTYDPAKGCQ